MEEVRRSIVRICFDWKKKEGYKVLVIPGIILSIDVNGNATIAANATFFIGKKFRCVVNFPNSIGYEDGIELSYDSVINGDNFSTFTLRPSGDGYIKPVKFEVQPVHIGDEVSAFVFPRESFVTPTGYCGGVILERNERIFIHDCDMHEYGYLGSPLFNLRGHLVGITFLDKGHLQAWTVLELQDVVLKNTKSTLVSNGEPMETPPIAEAQVEEILSSRT